MSEAWIHDHAEITRLRADNRSHETTIARYADEIVKLRTEVERLHELFRKDGEQHAAHIRGLNEQYETSLNAYSAEIERLRAHNNRLISRGHDFSEMITERDAQLTEAAAFFDVLAERTDLMFEILADPRLDNIAAECRTMAKKLRGET